MGFGASSALISHYRPAIPNCCKLWFPMTETGGSRILDIAGGVVLQPASLAFDIAGAVEPRDTAGVAPTSGSFPTLATKDFIYMVVYHQDGDPTFGGATVRPQATTYFKDAANATVFGLYDGDGCIIGNADGTTRAGTETLCGASARGAQDAGIACHAVVREGDAIGDWMHNSTWNVSGGSENDFVAGGDVFARILRNNNYTTTTPIPLDVFGHYGRNDHGVSAATIASWQPDPATGGVLNAVTSEAGVGLFNGGIPGVYPYIDPAYSLRQPTKLTFGINLTAKISYYGMAIFAFDNGLPSDYKEALRWMRDQWVSGNKVIWPAWANL